MNQTLGHFVSTFPPEHDSLEIVFTPTSKHIKYRWRDNRLSAHFLADYFVNFLPLGDTQADLDEKRIKESKSAVSYVGNELLENAMKFHNGVSHHKVRLGIHFLETSDSSIIAAIFATNSVTCSVAEQFKMFIQELLASDPEEMYVRQIECSAEEGNDEASGLGILTMINDYSAVLGWKFEGSEDQPDMVTLTTMAQIRL